MSDDKKTNTVDVSKITEKEKIVTRYKTTGKTMNEFEKLVGNDKGISKGSANNAWQEAKRKTGLNSAQLTVLAKTTKLFDKKK